jgi:hypothetical protein
MAGPSRIRSRRYPTFHALDALRRRRDHGFRRGADHRRNLYRPPGASGASATVRFNGAAGVLTTWPNWPETCS